MTLTVGWLRRLQQEWVIPEIIPERCVHSRCEVAECARCVDACPHDAWVLTDDSLQIDLERCDGCGLCVAACTESALEQALLPALRMHEGRATLLFACEMIGEGYAGEGVVPCLHAITASQWLAHYRDGYQQVLSCRGDCTHCPRYPGKDAFREQLAVLNRLLASRSAPTIRHAELEEEAWAGRRGEEARKTDRRQFLQRAIHFTVEKGMEQAGMVAATEEETLPWPATLPAGETASQPVLWPFVPQMDALHCNGCDACAQLCPHQALQLDKDDNSQATAYRIRADHCTGCGICVDVCDQQAIRLLPLAAASQAQLPLVNATCKACGCRFHYPASADGIRPHCRICSHTNHHRQLFQVYR